jgi:hypothetical protein
MSKVADDLDIEFALAGVKHRDDASFEERFIGCPVWCLLRALSLTKSAPELVVAQYVWRRHVVVGRRTFNMPNGELKALGVKRQIKYRMLIKLKEAGLITIRQEGCGAPTVTIRTRRRT